jgi:Chaperone of endosialidase
MRPSSTINYSGILGNLTPSLLDLINSPISSIGPNAPSTYKRITYAKFIGANLTGGKARIEVYCESPVTFAAGDKVILYGIRRAIGFEDFSGTQTILDVGKAYSTTSKKVVTSTENVFSFTTTLTDKTTSPISIQTKNRIASYSATVTTATIVLTDPNHFEVGDTISVFGIDSQFDGAFKVTNANDTTLTYDFPEALAASVPSTVPNIEADVFGVYHEYVQVGDTWVSPDKAVYVWDGFKWVDYATSAVPDDGVAPAPPTNVTATSKGDTDPHDGRARSIVTVSWNAPTLNANGSKLRDLAGYKILWSDSPTHDYLGHQESYGSATSITLTTAFPPDIDLYFYVQAFDSGKPAQVSVPSDRYHLTTTAPASTAVAPSAPVLSSRLGVVQVDWDGKIFSGDALEPRSVSHVEVHVSTASGFTPSSTTLKSTIPYTPDSPKAHTVVGGLDYGVTYYFVLVAVEYNHIATPKSGQTSIVIKPLVDTDLIANSIANWPFVGGVVNANALANGAVSARSLAQNAISNENIANVITPGAISTGLIAANAIGTDQLAAGSIVSGKIGAGEIKANNIAALAIETGKLAANAVTADKANVGSLTAVIVTADTITSEVMSGSKYVEFSGAGGTNRVRLGYGTGSYATHPGMAITDAGNYVGWVGAWGDSELEVATDYYGCYLDMFRATNAVVLRGQTVTISATPLQNGTTGYMYMDSLRLYQTGAMTIGSSNSSAFRVEPTNGVGYHMSLNAAVGGTANYARLYVDPKLTSRAGLQIEGIINHYGLNNLSSRRFKEDIRPYNAEAVKSALLDMEIVNYKYLNTDGSSNPEALDQIGVIAEDIISLGLSDLVNYEDDGITPHGVDYAKFGLLLIPIVKDLKNEINELKNKLGDS